MKKISFKMMFMVLAMSFIAVNANAQLNRNYIKNKIRAWGECRNVAITRTNGDVALYGRCGYAASNIPKGLRDELNKLNSQKAYIDDVQLTERGKWVILYGNNGAIWSAGLPSDFVEKIKEFNRENYIITSLSFNDKGDWVIISDKYYAASSTEIKNWLSEGNEKYGQIWSVCVTDDAIVAVFEGGYKFRGNISQSLQDALDNTKMDVYRLKISGSAWFFADKNGNYRYNL